MDNSKENLSIYQLYHSDGTSASWDELTDAMSKSDIVLFGEEHDNVISHWLQKELYKQLRKNGPVTIGLEMIERDQEDAFQAFIRKDINKRELNDSIKLWNNFYSDYLPLIELATENGDKVVGTNVPRRYASALFHGGMESLDTLSAQEKSWIAPLPFPYDKTLPSYVAMLEMMEGHGGETFPMAQAIKDATMAHFLLENKEKDVVFLHLNGSYHSDDKEGIAWYINQYQPGYEIKTITTKSSKLSDKLPEEFKGKADFIILVDESFPRSY